MRCPGLPVGEPSPASNVVPVDKKARWSRVTLSAGDKPCLGWFRSTRPDRWDTAPSGRTQALSVPLEEDVQVRSAPPPRPPFSDRSPRRPCRGGICAIYWRRRTLLTALTFIVQAVDDERKMVTGYDSIFGGRVNKMAILFTSLQPALSR